MKKPRRNKNRAPLDSKTIITYNDDFYTRVNALPENELKKMHRRERRFIKQFIQLLNILEVLSDPELN